MASGKIEESVKILKKGSKMNGKKQWPDDINLDHINADSTKRDKKSFLTEVKEMLGGFLRLIRTKEMRKRTLIMSYIWYKRYC